MDELLLRMISVVDDAINALSVVEFIPDPISGPEYSLITSIVSSAYKRHGSILEIAIRAKLAQHDRYRVWHEKKFCISSAAINLSSGQSDEVCRATTLPYGERAREIQVDMLVYDHVDHSLRSYEIKRGTSYNDAGKKRQILLDLKCVQMLLRGYGVTQGVGRVDTVGAYIIAYYGWRSLPMPWSLIGVELDQHFQCEGLRTAVETVNAYFSAELYKLLEKRRETVNEKEDYNEQ